MHLVYPSLNEEVTRLADHETVGLPRATRRRNFSQQFERRGAADFASCSPDTMGSRTQTCKMARPAVSPRRRRRRWQPPRQQDRMCRPWCSVLRPVARTALLVAPRNARGALIIVIIPRVHSHSRRLIPRLVALRSRARTATAGDETALGSIWLAKNRCMRWEFHISCRISFRDNHHARISWRIRTFCLASSGSLNSSHEPFTFYLIPSDCKRDVDNFLQSSMIALSTICTGNSCTRALSFNTLSVYLNVLHK